MGYKHLDADGEKIFITMIMFEQKKEDIKIMIEEFKNTYSSTAIISKRIDVLKLPIKFTDYAMVAVNALVTIPGEAVLLLIEALEKFENQEVDTEKLSDLYPDGFYDQETFNDIANKVKERKSGYKFEGIY